MTAGSTAPVRVLVVDDSAFARKVMREVLDAHPRISVVAVARDGIDALEKIAELKPDVVALDLVMPHLDGVGVLDALGMLPSPPRVVVVTTADDTSVLVVAALLSGAYAVVHKPTSLATDRLYELGAELVQKVLLAADARPASANISSSPTPNAPTSHVAALDAIARPSGRDLLTASTTTKMVVVGASTGGPRAISQLLAALPKTFSSPIAVVVHMPPGYTDAFASRLDRESALHVVEAEDGMPLTVGLVVIARAGIHMRIEKADGRGNWRVALDVHPMDAIHRPSVDALFQSAASEVGGDVIGVVLTGMGADGREGARAIRGVGGQIIVEHESTCVVYGMPRAIVDEGLASAQVPLPGIAAALIARL